VTGCDTHGELLGGYVLDALSAEETETMRRHLMDCSACAGEYAALASLPGLLDRIEPSDVPPPVPPPALEEAVLDRWMREHRRARGLEAGGRGMRRGPRPKRGRQGRRRLGAVPIGRAAAAVLGALLIAAVALALLLPDNDDPYAHGTLAGAQGADGSFTVERVSTGTRVYLEADRLPRDAYEVWCVRTDGRWISGGSFHANAAGRAAVTLTAAVAPGDYHTVIVTRGTPENGHGNEVMRGKLVY
jgi:anti-sigma factor RsiW